MCLIRNGEKIKKYVMCRRHVFGLSLGGCGALGPTPVVVRFSKGTFSKKDFNGIILSKYCDLYYL